MEFLLQAIQFKEFECQSLLPSGHNHLGVANTVLVLSVELHSQLFDHSIVTLPTNHLELIVVQYQLFIDELEIQTLVLSGRAPDTIYLSI